MNCYANDLFEMHDDTCVVNNLRYFLVKVNSDLNPTNGAVGVLGADVYDENSNNTVIKFSQVNLVTITVIVSDKVQKIFDSGAALSGFDINFEQINQYLNGTAVGHNQVAFSFTFTNNLLSPYLQQNSFVDVTVTADVEVVYADGSRKRVTLETSTDQSSFTTTQQVQDDSGITTTTKSNSIALIASVLMMMIFALF